MNRVGRMLRSAGSLLLLGWPAVAQTTAARDLPGRDLQGRAVALGGPARARVAIIVFVATDCPISNRYAPEIGRLEREFAGRAPLWVVYPNVTETVAGIQAHERAFGMALPGRVLRGDELVALTGAKVTPEAAVLVRDGAGWRPAYVGRIDDHYLRIGQERTTTQRHDLEEAVTAVLAGKTAQPPGGPVVGCGIVGAR